MTPPDLTFIFSQDVVEWDTYLSRQFEGSGTTIHHEQVENITFPLSTSKIPTFSDSRVTLVILSPAFLTFLDEHAYECFQFMKLLKPGKTIAMLCGVQPSNICNVKDVLVSYDDWRHLEAKDKDINMVRNVIELIQEMLAKSKENERITKPKFKLVPRKVHEGNAKVYVILAKPLDSNAKMRISLETNTVREVPVKKRNPYTLVFVMPDHLMQVQTLVNVHIWCGEDLLGVSQVKCASKMGELFSLLSAVNSPYEFLCNTLGLSTLHNVDDHLTSTFKKNLPNSGFEMLHSDYESEKSKSKDELPTLLHFAARYGLCQLVKELLNCPGAQAVAGLRNVRGLSPAQLANYAGHNEAAAAIDEYLKNIYSKNKQEAISNLQISDETERNSHNPADYYDIPAQPVPVLQVPTPRIIDTSNEKEFEYLKMKSPNKVENTPLTSPTLFDTSKKESNGDVWCRRPTLSSSNSMEMECTQAERAKLSLLESQTKLIEIMEAYKKGASLTEVEKLHNEWKASYQVSDVEAKSTLEGLRNLYAKAQRAKMNKKHSSSFSELRQFLNSKLRRKESLGSKGNLSRKHSKDLGSVEKVYTDSEANRPVSTLSVLSNTSSSSGSSFDRLSTASAGSDSGHHSDFCEDRHNRHKDKFDSRYQRQLIHAMGHVQKNLQGISLNCRPPAPPPRHPKIVSRFGSLEDCKTSEVPQYATAKKFSSPSFDEVFKTDYMQPDRTSCISNDTFGPIKRTSISVTDISGFDDPNANYDCPPPPRPNCCTTIKSMTIGNNSRRSSLSRSPGMDYDLVPPPLPLSAPPRKSEIFDSYDIPKPATNDHQFQRSNSFSLDYDLPKSTFMDNSNLLPACTCHVSSTKPDAKTVKSCCTGNKLSMLQRKNSLPAVPPLDVVIPNDKQNELKTSNKSAIRNQYYNVCLRPARDRKNEHRDSIPEELAPPPPVEGESAEDHYKIVGLPIPITSSINAV